MVKMEINDCYQFLDMPSSTEPIVATTKLPTDIGKSRAATYVRGP